MQPNKQEIKQVLQRVKARIEDREHWTMGERAKTSRGLKAEPQADGAVCWCLIGAFEKETGIRDMCDIPAAHFLAQVAGRTTNHLWGYNDAHGHAAVLKLLDSGIAECDRI